MRGGGEYVFIGGNLVDEVCSLECVEEGKKAGYLDDAYAPNGFDRVSVGDTPGLRDGPPFGLSISSSSEISWSLAVFGWARDSMLGLLKRLVPDCPGCGGDRSLFSSKELSSRPELVDEVGDTARLKALVVVANLTGVTAVAG